MRVDEDSPQVRFPPPIMFLIAIGAGFFLESIKPLSFLDKPLNILCGGVLFALAGSILVSCAREFKKSRTHIKPWKSTRVIITTGAYRFSRNPMYLGALIFGVAIASLAQSGWILMMLVPFAAVIDRHVIAKEERYLKNKFGKIYTDYASKVRRWV